MGSLIFPGKRERGIRRLILKIYLFLFIYFWLRWVFIAAHGLSLVAAGGGYSSLQSVRLVAAASLVAEHGL